MTPWGGVVFWGSPKACFGEGNIVKVHCDKEQDILYFAFNDGPSHGVLESTPNVVLEIDENKEIMGLEIWDARKIGLLDQVAKATIGS